MTATRRAIAAAPPEPGDPFEPLPWVHVDVFTDTPYGGNSLAVFTRAESLDGAQALRLTQELRHFESVFLGEPDANGRVPTRVFDQVEELPFAGHPLLGAAAVLHEARMASGADAGALAWRLALPGRVVDVRTERTNRGFRAWMDQGMPELADLPRDGRVEIAAAFGLAPGDLDAIHAPALASTGLRYLVVPVAPGVLARARVMHDVSPLVARLGASYAVLFDESARELRHWTNDGLLEDAATGSAAGAIGAWRLRAGLASDGEPVELRQGRFVGRPSRLSVRAHGTRDAASRVEVGGDVVVIGRGRIERRP